MSPKEKKEVHTIPNFSDLRGKARIEEFPTKSITIKEGYNVRTNTSPDDLVQSVKQNGILQPIHVRWENFPKLIVSIIDGERRFRAALAAGLKVVPCINYEFITEEAAAVVAFTANEGQKPLTIREKCKGVKRLAELGYGTSEISKIMHLDKSTVSKYQTVSKVTPRLRNAVEMGEISARTAVKAAALPARQQEKVVSRAKGKTEAVANAVVDQVKATNPFRPVIHKAAPTPYVWPADFTERFRELEKVVQERLSLSRENKVLQGQMFVLQILRGKLNVSDIFSAKYQ